MTARLLLIPVVSALLLVGALLFTAATQSRNDALARQVVANGIDDARAYGALLDRALRLHSRYLDLASERLAARLAPHEQNGVNSLLGAALDLNAEVDALRDRPPAAGTAPGAAPDRSRLDKISLQLVEFQDVVARIAGPRSAEQIRADIAESNVQIDAIGSALTSLITSAQSSGDRAFRGLEYHVRHSLAVIALVLIAVVVLTVLMVVWTQRRFTHPLRDVAGAMRRFRENPAVDARVQIMSSDEVGEIATGFNGLVETIQSRERALESSARLLREGNAKLKDEVSERSAAEKQLRRSRELLEAAQSAGGIGVFDIDLEARLVRGSRQFFALLGLPPETDQLTQDQWLGAVHPEDIEALLAAFGEALQSEGSYLAEYRLMRRDRSVIWVSGAGSVLSEESRGSRRIVGSIVDITRRKAAEQDLQNVADSLSMAQMAGGVATYDTDRSKRTTRHSENYPTLFGLPSGQQVTREAWLARIHPEDRERALLPEREPSADGFRYASEYRIVKPDGSTAWIGERGTALTDENNDVVRLSGAVFDVTARKAAEVAVAELQVRLARAVEGTSDGLFEWDYRTGRIWFAPRVAALVGCDPATFPTSAEGLYAIMHPDDREPMQARLHEHIQSGTPYDTEFRVRDARDEWQWLRCRARAERTAEGGGGLMIAGSLQLVTDRRQQAEELEAARTTAERASRAKSEFLANMSHEIRTPINGVIGMTHVLLDTPLSESQRECVEIVRSSGESLLALVNDILDFSKIEAGRMDLEHIELDPRALIDETVAGVALQAAMKGLEVVSRIAPSVPAIVRGDPSRVRQCLLNLLSNAIKFTPTGHVAVEVDATADEAPGVVLRFAVADTGIGIAPDRMDRLFAEFSQVDSSTTRHFGGTGLGLSIVRRLAQLMGGATGVESEVGRGSTFWFNGRFEPVANATAPGMGPVAGFEPARVLVLDDCEIAARYAAGDLALQGYDAAWCTDVESLTRELAAFPRDVLIADEGVTGLDLAAIRAKAPELRVILLSPLGAGGSHVHSSGFEAILTKPLRQRHLLQALDRVLGRAVRVADADVARSDVANRRVLLVEDNPVNRRVAQHQLEKLGMSVGSATNGAEAIAAWEAEHWDVVLMDCQMPVMDGFAATREIRRRERGGQRVPIVALTANALQGDREACLAAGMDDYLPKPLDPAALRTTLERWTAAGATRAAPAGASEPAAKAAPAAEPDAPPVDLEALRVLTDGDPAFERELIEVFVTSGDRELEDIVAALDAADLAGVRKHAHALKGASGNLRARALAATAARVENAAAAGDFAQAREATDALVHDYRTAIDYLAAAR